MLEEQTREEILAANQNIIDLVQGLIALEASKNLKNTNYKAFMELGLIYFRNYNKISPLRKLYMETVFKYLQPRSEYLEGYAFFSHICAGIETDVFLVEMAFALFFAYQLKKFEDVNGILNYYFLRLEPSDYSYAKYICMYYFYQGQYYLMMKVIKF